MVIQVYVCPTPGCGNYFGSSSQSSKELEKQVTGDRGMNGENNPERGHSRAQCPDCRDRGDSVERVLVFVSIKAPTAAAA